MTRNRKLALAAAWLLVILFINSINATSELMERARQGPPVESWKPFVWEYTSGVAMWLLIPAILWLDRRLPLRDSRWRLPAAVHAAATVAFSLAHVAMMVGMRKVIYVLNGQHYDFGNVPVELLYEYRKDFVSYFLVLGAIYAWRLFQARRAGAAYEDNDERADLPRFLVRNRGRTYHIASEDIDWVEAAGNYVLLHVGGETHPLRDTMKGIENRLGDGFCRVHRSTVVNLDRVDRTLPAGGGEFYVRLHNGTELKCSRTLKDVLQRRLESGAVTPDRSASGAAH